ncbi:hypothetical protein [Paraclostridium bifermentans]|uniref:hypothetical protein n=1 Tax=Paraclostridium bifermentans TaxID=1490 RepID=UPI0018A8C288|nr:hypothetical protein [Paraclostridium bifermentans]
MNNGLSLESYMDASDNEDLKIVNLELNSSLKKEISEMIDRIKEDKNMNSYQKGSLFENTIEKILLGTKVFKCIKNKHTTSNEFDLLVKLNFNGRCMRDRRIIPTWIPDEFLIECKNHNKAVEVGLIGKFYSLMDVSKISLGIFISREGASGRNEKRWCDAAAFINKINLKYSESQNPRILLDFSIDEIQKVLDDNQNIIDLIHEKKIQIDMDINGDLQQWISNHENEGDFRK